MNKKSARTNKSKVEKLIYDSWCHKQGETSAYIIRFQLNTCYSTKKKEVLYILTRGFHINFHEPC